MTEITYNAKFAPLFDLKTRYCIVIGGRGSGKSHAKSTEEVVNTFEKNQVSLFTRYTMTSAEISIVPEFWEKVELMGYESVFHKTENSIKNKMTGSYILFRGIKTSSGNQTASLKSIANLTRWTLDEAEELVDETTFDKIDLSVRKKGENIHVILILNAPDEDHFIIRKFFTKRDIPFDFNGVSGDCTYIHTTYLDNLKNLDESFVKLAEDVKAKDPEKYKHIFLGYPTTQAEGVVYKNWSKISEFPSNLYTWYGVDFGFVNDPTAIIRICFDRKANSIYLHEVAYQKGFTNADIARIIKQDYRSRETELFHDGENRIIHRNERIILNGTEIPEGKFNEALESIRASQHLPVINRQLKQITDVLTESYCDSAEQKSIAELRLYGVSAYPAIKGAGSVVNQIQFVKYFNIYYTASSENINHEVKNYKWMQKKEGGLDNKPIDAFNHAMDAARYGIYTHLTRNGYEYDEILGAKESA